MKKVSQLDHVTLAAAGPQQPLQVVSVDRIEEMPMHADVYLFKCSCACCMLSKRNLLDDRSDPLHRLSATTAVGCAITAVAAVITFQLNVPVPLFCRLLDDNRQLFVPELQETINPHPHFMLFATQNPPGKESALL